MTSSRSGEAGRPRSLVVVLLLCWAALAADGYDLMAYGATLPALIGRPPFHIAVGEGGHIGSIGLTGMLVGSLAAGTLTDRIGRRRLFIAGVLVFSVGMLGTAGAPDTGSFVAGRIVTGLGVGGLLPTAVALASEFAPVGGRSRALGAVLTGPPLGMVLAAYVASELTPAHGFRPVYALAGFGLLLVPLLVVLLPESPAHLAARERPDGAGPAGTPARSVVSAVIGPRVLTGTLLVWATTFCSLLTAFGATTWLPQVMQSSGYGMASSIQFLAVYCLGAVVSTLVASRIADATGPKILVVIGFVCAAAALLAISGRPPTGVLYVLVLLAGFGGYGTQNLLNDFIARHYPAPARAGGLGWALAFGRLGAILGPTFGAWAAERAAPLKATALAFGCTAVLGALVMTLTPRTSRAFDERVAETGPTRPAHRTTTDPLEECS